MKKIYLKFALLLTLLVSFSACNDFLEPDNNSELNPEDLFKDPSAVNNAVLRIYDIMTENRSYRNRMIGYLGVNTDIETHSGSKNTSLSDNNRRTLAVYLANSGLADGFNDKDGADPWSRVYSAIEVANQCVAYIQEYGNPDVEKNSDMAYYLGEALTLRAFLYNDLIKNWGDVPYRFEPMNPNILYVPKVDRDIIYRKLLEDLDRAEGLMTWSSGNRQRVTLGLVKALKARIALQAAGYSQRKRSADDVQIVRTFPKETRDSLYRVARIACQEIVGSNVYQLTSSFESFFKQQCAAKDASSLPSEGIYYMPFSQNRGEYVSYLGLRHEFEANTSDKWATITIKNEVSVMPTFFYDYDPADQRRDVTVVPYKWKDGVQVMTAVNNFNLAKWRAEWCDRVISSNDDGVNFCVIRYADVLLMLAETINELEGPAGALTYFEQVRSRAFGGDPNLDLVEAKYPAFRSNKTDFFNALVDERAFEFCGENVRKWDLMRWGILGKKMAEAKTHLEQLRNSGEGSGDMGTYATVPSKVYWRWNDDNETITIYGMNRDETDTSDKTSANGWNSKTWTNAVESATGKSLLDQATYVEKAVYHADPEKNQLLPIMNVVISNSQGSLTNDPLTDWTAY